MTVVRTGTGLDEDAALGVWQAAQAHLGRRNGGTRAQRVRAALRSPDALLLVAERDSAVVGVLQAALVRSDGGAALEVVLLAVEPAVQRSGVGRALVQALLARFPQVSARTHADDVAAEALLEACGLRRVDDDPQRWRPPA